MLETKLQRIAMRSKAHPELKFDKLMPLFNKDNLLKCFHELKAGRATGIDKIDKEEYAKELNNNIDILISKMKTMSYRPKPVKEVLIPKGNGKKRPLGISVIEDKMVQLLFAKVLEAIFEPHFLDCSYGFRPGKSCHQAIKEINNYLFQSWHPVIIDADLKNYFGTIDHKMLLNMLGSHIADRRFLGYIVRILKSGIFREGNFIKTDEGTPQGAICSPILSNIYAHYAIDIWMDKMVKPMLPHTKVIRYADDFVICCKEVSEAERIMIALPKRLNKFNLQLNTEKSKLVQMNKGSFAKGTRQGTFNFLGFTFYLALTRGGTVAPKIKTDAKKFRAKLKSVKEWVKSNRNVRFRELYLKFNKKLEGHARYYGISNNIGNVDKFIYQALKIFYKWMNRRSQKPSMSWDKFYLFVNSNPKIKPQVYFKLF